MQLEEETLIQLEKLRGESDWNELIKEFLKIREEKLTAEKPEAVQTSSRHIPNKIKRHILARCRGSCEFPTCQKKYQILHHTGRFALQKEHCVDSIVALCEAHERLAHLGLIENEEQQSGKWGIKAQADESLPKYQIDRLVATYRNPKTW